MTEKGFLRIVERSAIAPFLLRDQSTMQFKVGMMIAILSYNIPPDLSYQESSPILPLRFRTHEIKDPRVRKYVETSPAYNVIAELRVVVWERAK
jgi:hypothetical protein